MKQPSRFLTNTVFVVVVGLAARIPQATAEQAEVDSLKAEVSVLRKVIEEQGKKLDRVYEFVNEQVNLDDWQQEREKDKHLALERVWESPPSVFTEWAVFSPVDPCFAAILQDGSVGIHGINGKQKQKLDLGTSRVSALAYSPEGTRLLLGTSDGKVLVWNSKNGKSKELLARKYSVSKVGWVGQEGRVFIESKLGVQNRSADSNELYDAEGEMFDIEGGKTLWPFTAWQHLDYQDLAAFPNGKRLAVFKILKERGVYLLDAASGKVGDAFISERGSGLSVAVSPDSRFAAVGMAPTGIEIWDVDMKKPVKFLQGHSNWVVALAFSPDGKRLVSGAGDSTARVWDIEQGTEIGRVRFPGPSTYIHSVSFSSDGKLVLVAGGEEKLIIAKLP